MPQAVGSSATLHEKGLGTSRWSTDQTYRFFVSSARPPPAASSYLLVNLRLPWPSLLSDPLLLCSLPTTGQPGR